MRYAHVFFDLDRTIWDFNANSEETIYELVEEFGLLELLDIKEFFKHYLEINDEMWALFRKNEITKEELRLTRFRQSLKRSGVENHQLAHEMGLNYVQRCPYKKHLMEGAIDMLTILKEKNVNLHVITNGFSTPQRTKLKNCSLLKFFDQLIISEEVGYKKPQKELFMYALKVSGANAKESLMIGDDLMVDVLGAQRAGMDQVHFNELIKHSSDVTPTYHIRKLKDLPEIVGV